MINFTWKIEAIEYAPIENNLEKVIKRIHWRYVGTEENNGTEITKDVYGVEEAGAPNSETFIPYEELSNEVIFAWLEKKLPVTQYQEIIAKAINNEINPQIIVDHNPFTTTTTSTTIVE